MTNEDLAHLIVESETAKDVIRGVAECLATSGYKAIGMRGDVHLQKTVNWESPFDPPPEYRCFLVLPSRDGWVTVVDEIDRLDVGLAKCLSKNWRVLTSRGHQAIGEFEYTFWVNGAQIDPDGATAALIRAIRSHPDHVTKFTYDEICLTLDDLDGKPLQFVGFSRGRPYRPSSW